MPPKAVHICNLPFYVPIYAMLLSWKFVSYIHEWFSSKKYTVLKSFYVSILSLFIITIIYNECNLFLLLLISYQLFCFPIMFSIIGHNC